MRFSSGGHDPSQSSAEGESECETTEGRLDGVEAGRSLEWNEEDIRNRRRRQLARERRKKKDEK